MTFLSLHSADIVQNHKWHLAFDCGNKYRAEKLILFRAKDMVKNKLWYQNAKTPHCFMHAYKKDILLHWKT